MRSVREQLAQFRKSMEADGAAQRSECRRLVSTAVRARGLAGGRGSAGGALVLDAVMEMQGFWSLKALMHYVRAAD